MSDSESTTPVKYIGRHARLNDSQHDTGDWENGEVKLVESLKAERMLRQADAYVRAKGAEAKDAEVAKPKADKVNETLKDEELKQEAREAVAKLSKDKLVEYAKVHYGQTLDKRISADKARTSVVQMIDRFGTK